MEEYRKYEPIFGSWYLSRLLGKGSFGKVFEITREEFGTTYRSALKIISIPQDDDDVKARMTEANDIQTVSEYYEGILREITTENEIMAQLKGNSNIVSYEDHQIIPHEDGIGYDILIRMELLTPLIDRMVEKRLDEKEVVKLGVDICKALEVCHKKNIIHRDIKPQNIFISDTGDFKLGDFGIARTIEKTTGGMSKKGTYKYMAPEVFRGEHYDSTVDIYSLGIVLYSLLNGNRGPFLPPPPAKVTHNDEEEARMRRFRGEPIPAPRDAGPMLAYIIQKACANDPWARYRTAEQMRRDLESYLNNYGSGTGFIPAGGVEEGTVVDDSIRNTTQQPRPYIPQGQGPSHQDGKKKIIIISLIAAVLLGAIIGTAVILKNRGAEDQGQTAGTDGQVQTEEGDDQEELPGYLRDASKLEYNGHYYQVFTDGISWSEAKAACEKMNGHLATVTSQEEHDFIQNLIERTRAKTDDKKYNFWLGGYEQDGKWKWVTGENFPDRDASPEAGFQNWYKNEPNDKTTETPDGVKENQNYLQMCCGSTDSEKYMKWWDMSDSGYSNKKTWDAPYYKKPEFTGYVCEWDTK